MTAPSTLLSVFQSNEQFRHHIEIVLDDLADLCAAVATEKGFRDDEFALAALLHSSLRDSADKPQALEWLASTIFQAEIARAHSELSEALEGARKPHADAHCPSFDNTIVELADAMIRLFDIIGRRKLPIGQAFVAKLQANCDRPHKHGKNS